MQMTFPVLLSDDMVAIPLLMSTIVKVFPALTGGELYYPMARCPAGRLRQIQTVTYNQSCQQEDATSAQVLGSVASSATLLGDAVDPQAGQG
jgi:hypothetical protein